LFPSTTLFRSPTIVFSSPGGIPENAGAAAPVPRVILVLILVAEPPCGMLCTAVAAAGDSGRVAPDVRPGGVVPTVGRCGRAGGEAESGRADPPPEADGDP